MIETFVFVRTKDQAGVEEDFDNFIDSLIVRGIPVFDSSITTSLVSDVDDSAEIILDLMGSDPGA